MHAQVFPLSSFTHQPLGPARPSGGAWVSGLEMASLAGRFNGQLSFRMVLFSTEPISFTSPAATTKFLPTMTIQVRSRSPLKISVPSEVMSLPLPHVLPLWFPPLQAGTTRRLTQLPTTLSTLSRRDGNLRNRSRTSPSCSNTVLRKSMTMTSFSTSPSTMSFMRG